jgi:hypothetical protein
LPVSHEKVTISTGKGVDVKHSTISIGFRLVLVVSFLSICTAAEEARPTATIHQAAQAGDANSVKQFLDAGTNPDMQDANQCTPLFYAVRSGSLAVVQLLLQRGANPDQTSGGETLRALAQANAQRYAQVAAVMNGRGADVRAEPSGRGRRGGMPAIPSASPYPSLEPEATPLQGGVTDANDAVIQAILADPNRVLAKLASFADVNEDVRKVDDRARPEERAWVVRTTDNRATLVRTVEHQFNDEMAVVKKVAEGEKAEKTAAEANELIAKRQKRYAAIYEEMRAQRQTAAAQNPGMTRGRGRGAAAGGMTMRGRGTAMMGNEAMPAAEPGRGVGQRRGQEADVGATDPGYEAQLQAWTSSTQENKRDLLAAVHDLDLRELELLDEAARGEKAEKTSAAIEALMVLHQERVARIGVAMDKEEQRAQRLEQRNTTSGRGRGGMMGGQQQQGMRGGRY